MNVYRALLDVHHMYSVFLSFDACLAPIQGAKLARRVLTPSFYYLRILSTETPLAYPPMLTVELGSYVDGEAHVWAR